MTDHQAAARTVVITGASGGIGRACAAAFAARRDRLALIARGRAGLDGAVHEAEPAGAAKAIAIEADVADPDSVEAAARRAEEELGPIDVWVNDAFASVFAPFTEITPEEFRRVTEVSYLGYVYATGAALRRMLPRGRGTVVQVGPAMAYRGISLQSAYSGAKHAIQGWHEALRCELLASGTAVRTTMVQMPAVNAPQFDRVRSRLSERAQPVPPIYQPEVAARAVLYAADHPARREYWVGGSTVATLLALPGPASRIPGPQTPMDPGRSAAEPRRASDPRTTGVTTMGSVPVSPDPDVTPVPPDPPPPPGSPTPPPEPPHPRPPDGEPDTEPGPAEPVEPPD
ncbi:short-subunit dehydrogenase [Streptomyces sp. TLI_235]|nr:SDR family oxidoreductase [Streptomyces sp. TLI_235]PBC70455.1 short-subunit dehydrogenase [Streptomyces sp. TLI_235]